MILTHMPQFGKKYSIFTFIRLPNSYFNFSGAGHEVPQVGFIIYYIYSLFIAYLI